MAIQKNDALTGQLPGVPAKRGRPPTGKAKSSAQRVRDYRERKRLESKASVAVVLEGDLAQALVDYRAKLVETHGELAPSVDDLVKSALKNQLYHWGWLGEEKYRSL